jgi:hypothetical protein
MAEMMVNVNVQVCTLRAQKARQLVDGWTRKYFVENQLKVARQTAHNWDQLIIEIYVNSGGKKFSDYLFDPGTGQPLWKAGQSWNHHQMWVLKDIKKFMSRSPKPLMEELRYYLESNANQLTHDSFYEVFNR